MTDNKTPCRWCSQPSTSHPNPMCDEYGIPGPADVPVHCCACGETFELSDQPGAIYPLVNGICRLCWKLIRQPNHAIVAENDRLKEEVDRQRERVRVANLDYAEMTAEIEQLRARLESCEAHYEAYASDDYGAWLGAFHAR